MTPPTKILKLTSENVKRLQAVEITPTGALVVVGGDNGAGKSSVLDSIEYALGGEPDDSMPVRKGQPKAKIVVDLGDLIVRRTFTAAGGSNLVITDRDGLKQSSPQAILDKLTGKLTFDPLDFTRQKAEKQAEILRELVNLDFTEHDKAAEAIYAERTDVNRDAAKLQARLGAMPKYEGLPAEETSPESILARQTAAAEENRNNGMARAEVQRLAAMRSRIAGELDTIQASKEGHQAEIEVLKRRIASLQAAIESCEKTIVSHNEKLAHVDAEHTQAAEAAAKLVDIDLGKFQAELREVESTNAKIRVSRERAAVAAEYRAKAQKSWELTETLERMEADRRQKITSAKYPIPGLSFDTAAGVTFGGIPFNQCSSAEQLKVSVAIGLALNPKLKVMLIHDGSLLDESNLALLATMAAEAGAQIWLERVGVDKATSVVIEDGHVKTVDDGTAKERLALSQAGPSAAQADEILGKPHYNAPKH